MSWRWSGGVSPAFGAVCDFDRRTAQGTVERASHWRWGAVPWRRMLTEYLRAAMAQAHYELLGDDEGFYGEIPGCPGVFAQADTLEACRDELASTLEDWLLFRIARHLSVPSVAGIELKVKELESLA